jgi:hypothetical protein
MSYYAILAIGAVVVPNWIRKVFLVNLKDKKENAAANLSPDSTK